MELKIYSQQEVADLLGRSWKFVGKLHKHGLLEGMKLGPSNLYTEEDVQNFLTNYKGYDVGSEKKMILAHQLFMAAKKKSASAVTER